MYRRSDTLIHCPNNSGLLSFNYLSKSEFECSEDLIEFLNQIDCWKTKEELSELATGYSSEELDEVLQALISCGALIEKGTTQEQIENEFKETWSWGIPAAALHFGLQDNKSMSVEAAEKLQLQKQKKKPQPPLFLKNDQYETIVELERGLPQNPLLSLMAKRRTNRSVRDQSITATILADCLFAGLGIVDSTNNCAGKLPLSMTPSGGARNPFEAYVMVQDVAGLEPGFYHYSAMEHNLGLVARSDAASVQPSKLIGDQAWMDDMPAIIFLVAYLERSMWKYQDPNAYRVMLIEAGHIGQNIMLSATDHQLTACPSAALSHKEIKDTFGIVGISRTPVYALGLGVPDYPQNA